MKLIFDLGNGYGKLVTPSGLSVSPSWVAPITDRTQAGNARVIEYVSGLSPHLSRGSMFAGGQDAATFLPQTSQRVGDYSDSTTQLQSKFLMRHLLSHHLGGMPLNTRQILIDLLQL